MGTRGSWCVDAEIQVDWRTTLLKGGVGGFKNSHDFTPRAPGRQWNGLVHDAVEEVLALSPERLVLLYEGSIRVPVMIGIVELCKGVVVRRTFDAYIKNLHFFLGGDVIIHDHPF